MFLPSPGVFTCSRYVENDATSAAMYCALYAAGGRGKNGNVVILFVMLIQTLSWILSASVASGLHAGDAKTPCNA